MSLDVAGSLVVWLAILSGILTILGTTYGLFLAVTQRRMDTNNRLNEAALISVRRAEAAIVRPILRERLLSVIEADSDDLSPVMLDAWQRRARTFAALQRSMSLSDTEKHTAHRYAINNLVSHLRRTPNPPLRVQTQGELNRHAVRLSELVENAYNLRPRLGAELIRSLGEFARGIDVSVPLTAPLTMKSSPPPSPTQQCPEQCAHVPEYF